MDGNLSVTKLTYCTKGDIQTYCSAHFYLWLRPLLAGGFQTAVQKGKAAQAEKGSSPPDVTQWVFPAFSVVQFIPMCSSKSTPHVLLSDTFPLLAQLLNRSPACSIRIKRTQRVAAVNKEALLKGKLIQAGKHAKQLPAACFKPTSILPVGYVVWAALASKDAPGLSVQLCSAAVPLSDPPRWALRWPPEPGMQVFCWSYHWGSVRCPGLRLLCFSRRPFSHLPEPGVPKDFRSRTSTSQEKKGGAKSGK